MYAYSDLIYNIISLYSHINAHMCLQYYMFKYNIRTKIFKYIYIYFNFVLKSICIVRNQITYLLPRNEFYYFLF